MTSLAGKTLWNSVGETPLVRLNSLSKITGCEILAKAEFMNPCGSIKDRTAKGIISQAERSGLLKPGGTIVEATAGNTGIALAALGRERGYNVLLTMPDNQSREKYEILKAMGVNVQTGPTCPFADSNHFYHRAEKWTREIPRAFFSDQFENPANSEIHFETTGPEIWEQCKGQVDVLVLATGTGGTLAGTSRYLKKKNEKCFVVAADCAGSVIYNYIKSGAAVAEGTSIAEGVGITRLTGNFKSALVDDTLFVTDAEIVDMAAHLALHDGLLVGMSSGLNAMAAYKLASGEFRNTGKTIVTFLGDHGSRYTSTLFNAAWLKAHDFIPSDLKS